MKSGELVRLKSGGPIMAVVSVAGPVIGSENSEQLVECVWIFGTEFRVGIFPEYSLEPVPESGPG